MARCARDDKFFNSINLSILFFRGGSNLLTYRHGYSLKLSVV